MTRNVIITGASSGFGALTARTLAERNCTVFAGMRDTKGHNAKAVADAQEFAQQREADLRTVELDVSDQESVDTAVSQVTDEVGQIDIVVHNAGHMVLGPTEAFTPEQMADVYDTNVISTQRLNRAVLPQMRERGDGHLIWVGSSSTFGGTPPYLGPYFAAKAAEDHAAKSYAVELTRFGIDTTIVVPGSFTSGTSHFAHAMEPEDKAVEAAYEERYAGLMDQVGERLAELAPPDADVSSVAQAIADVVDKPKGARPFRVTIDPADDGSERVTDVADAVREDFYERIDLTDVLHVRTDD
jgi:NAD(P)-dependent dehydrogenase (short-subunit alcohol dehydrogenase family)